MEISLHRTLLRTSDGQSALSLPSVWESVLNCHGFQRDENVCPTCFESGKDKKNKKKKKRSRTLVSGGDKLIRKLIKND